MSQTVIHARNLTKVYRLYAGPGYRFLDMFGLLGSKDGAYSEHAALDGVDLDIRRGEKVAFIGRNGAGKSTLLKLLTGIIEPTTGSLRVEGKAHALLQIGSGFHPDFTGRENVYAYLAQLGVTGREADRKYAEIVEFAELEEYIGQPVKTYSSGMAVRLMFSTSTAITPDLLVLDEVLGVGDAYFAHKSYARIRELCDRQGATLLLVTHDVYSAVSICERVIWIDRGRILMDGDGATVVNAYENSIRLQEEQRLRLKAEQRSRELSASAGAVVGVELYAADGVPQPCPVYFSRIQLLVNGVAIAGLPLDGSAKADAALQLEGTNWGGAVAWEGRGARAMQNFGSPFHKVAGTFAVPPGAGDVTAGNVSVEIDYWSAQPCALGIRAFIDGRDVPLGALPPAVAAWTTHRAVAAEMTAAEKIRTLTPAGRQGTGAIVIDAVTPLNGDQRETHAFRHGEPFELRMRYRIHQPGLRERPQILVAFHRDGVQDVMRTICRDFVFDERLRQAGEIVLRLPRLALANGTYSVTVMVAREGYYDEQQTIYFSINPGVYTCLTRIFDITVESGGIVGTGTGVVAEGDWHMVDDATLELDLAASLEREFPAEFPKAADTTAAVVSRLGATDLSPLARRSPSLAGYDWANYLRCSLGRVVRVQRALAAHVPPGGRVLDFGSYFGNFGLACQAMGFRVEAVDAYREYGPALAPWVALQRDAGIIVHDFADTGYDLATLGRGTYDAIICAGVIEHIPHTPRQLLETMTALLKPGGVLVLDTPNLAYLYKRRALEQGQSIFAPIAQQYFTELPFEGHHREYTVAEVEWLLKAAGQDIVSIETFNYSMFGQSRLEGEHLAHYRAMEADPSRRELILSVSRRPAA